VKLARKQGRMPTHSLAVGDDWSFRHPADPPLSSRMPITQARDAVYKVVTELNERGALDAGNGDVLDAWIDRLRPQWLAHHVMVSAEAEAAAQLVAGKYETAVEEARGKAELARSERDHTQRLVEIYEERLLTPNEGSAMEHPDRRRRPRPSLDALEGLTPQRFWRVLSIGLLVLAALGDFASFWIVLAGVMGQQEFIIWFLTAAFTAAAVGVMHMVGRTARNLREGQGGLGRTALVVMTLGWMALGATAFFVRTQAEEGGASSALPAFGAEAVPTGENPLLSALLLATLYLASGLLAFWIGFSDHHPRMKSYLALRRTLRAHQQRVAETERNAVEAERLAANARAELDRTKARSAAAESSVDAEIAELKELVRVHVAGLIGEPASTNNLTSGRAIAESPLPGGAVPAVPQQALNGMSPLGRGHNGNLNGHAAYR
jgi:hypothetical protein